MEFDEYFLSNQSSGDDKHTTNSKFSKIRTLAKEAKYIYSIKERRILFAKGWEDLLGYSSKDISMEMLLKITTPDFIGFSRAMFIKTLAFILSKTENLFDYTCTYESKKYNKQNEEISVIESFEVFKVNHHRVTEFMGTYKLNPRKSSLHKKYLFATGPDIEEILEEMREYTDDKYFLTKKERQVLKLLLEGRILKDIAYELKISKSNVEKMIGKMRREFMVNSTKELIIYALKNQLL